MATTKSNKKSEMTSEAYDLLDCFVSGLDGVIYEIAEALARTKGRVTPDGVAQIERDDVREAATTVFDAIRAEAGKSLAPEVAEQLQLMHNCVLEKCKADNSSS